MLSFDILSLSSAACFGDAVEEDDDDDMYGYGGERKYKGRKGVSSEMVVKSRKGVSSNLARNHGAKGYETSEESSEKAKISFYDPDADESSKKVKHYDAAGALTLFFTVCLLTIKLTCFVKQC